MEKAKAWFEKHKESKVKEHVSAILPFKVLEKIVDKPLRIRGIAMTTGMSRNFNIYTPEELQAFSQKLVSAPVYIEHVAVPNAVGKVTKTEWDGTNLWYEAEIYDDETAEKIRKGLIQHVSVGADYETLDVLDGKVPHGLHNAELSLVAVPGIPETNVHVLEKLASSAVDHSATRARSPNPKLEAEKMVNTQGLKEQNGEDQQKPTLKPEEGEEYQAFIKRCIAAGNEMEQCANIWKKSHPEQGEGNSQTQERLTEAEWDTEYINSLPDACFAYIEPGGEKDEEGKTKPRSLRHLPFKNAQGNIDHDHLVNALARLQQTELSAEAKAEAKKKLCAAVKQWNSEHSDNQIESEVCNVEPSNQERLRATVEELTARVERLEKALEGTQGSLAESLLKKPEEPVIPVKEAVKILEGLLPSPMVERSSLGMQRECQEIRRAIWQLKEQMKNA